MLRKPTGLWRRGVAFTLSGVVAGLVAVQTPDVQGQEGPVEPVVRVEEDWVLVLYEPDDTADSPQFHTLMSPYDHTEYVFIQSSWNYWERPDFTSGGVQLQAWASDYCLWTEGYFGKSALSTDAEVITWTQALETNGEILTYAVENGSSQTWGLFGGESMKLSGYVHVADLAGYSPDLSAANSWVSYGTNRVEYLALKEVRYYSESGLLYSDTAPRVVYEME